MKDAKNKNNWWVHYASIAVMGKLLELRESIDDAGYMEALGEYANELDDKILDIVKYLDGIIMETPPE